MLKNYNKSNYLKKKIFFIYFLKKKFDLLNKKKKIANYKTLFFKYTFNKKKFFS